MRGAASILAVAALAGCSGPPPEVTPALVASARGHWSDVREAELVRGRETFMTHCGRCHTRPDPALHDEREWAYYLHEMAPKAQLTDEEQREVLRFLVAAHDVLAAEAR